MNALRWLIVAGALGLLVGTTGTVQGATRVSPPIFINNGIDV